MSKTTRFSIHESPNPQGTTFQGNRTHAPDVAASWGQSKPKRRFSINSNDPQGVTFAGNKSHISLPSANKTPPTTKSLSSSTGLYKPEKVKARDFGGSVGVNGPGKK